MKHLYIMRHGESEANVQGVWSGRTDTLLTDGGRAQAKQAGQQAKDLHIDLIIASPLARAHETAAIIAQEIGYPQEKIELNDLLIERSFGSLENTPYAATHDVDSVADAEKEHELEARTRQFYEYIKTLDAENILLVSHGSTGRMLRHVLVPTIPFNSTAKGHHLPNAEIIQLL